MWRLSCAIRSQNSKAFSLGLFITLIYYAILHQPFMQDSILQGYTTHHATEYAIVWLFFWANCEHLFALIRSRREEKGLSLRWLPKLSGLDDVKNAESLLALVTKEKSYASNTLMYRRLVAALRFVAERRSVDGFREYLDSLAARDSEEVFQRYSFSRFVTAVLPIIGLIGTVVHFGAALGGLTLDGLAEKLPNLLGGMGTAFNTTFTAMSALVITMLIRFLIERKDSGILAKIDSFIEDELLYRFKTQDGEIAPFINAMRYSLDNLMQSLSRYEQKLGQEWEARHEASQARWSDQFTRQEHSFAKFLQHMIAELNANATHIRDVRNDLVTAQNMITQVANAIIGGGQLLELQDRLAENLAVLQHSQHLEGAMHELTAAIHLFTARQTISSSVRKSA